MMIIVFNDIFSLFFRVFICRFVVCDVKGGVRININKRGEMVLVSVVIWFIFISLMILLMGLSELWYLVESLLMVGGC